MSAPSTDRRPASLQRFDTIRLRTECGFARGATLWGSDEWPAGGLEPVIAKFAELLGRLVAEDEGAHPDDEEDLVARDVGIDGGAASAEEAAIHVVDDDDTDIRSGD